MNEKVGNLEVIITKDASSCGFDNVNVKLTLLNKYIYEKESVVTILPKHIVKFENIPLGHYNVEVFCKGYLGKKDYVHVKFPGPDTHWNGHFRKSRNKKYIKIKKWSYSFVKPLRSVDTVFLHCSASDAPEHDSVDVMTQWHKKRGFSDIGYHFFIKKDGVIQKGRNIEKDPAAQKGYNKGTIAICLHGLDVNKFTTQQFNLLIELCHAIKGSYTKPIRFRGHKEVAAKACPVFDYKKVLKLNKNGYMSR
jgi:hypothetical protein